MQSKRLKITKSVFNAPLSVHSWVRFFCLCWLFFRSFFCLFFVLIFWSFFDRFGDAFWELLRGQNRPKTGQVGLKTALETVFFENSEFSKKALKTNRISMFLTPRAVTKRPKIVPKRCQGDLEEMFFSLRFWHRFLVVFWSDFGLILGGFWEPLGGPNRSFVASIFWYFLYVVPRAAQERPRAAPERPRAAQERPRAA